MKKILITIVSLAVLSFLIKGWWFNLSKSAYVPLSGNVKEYEKSPFYLATYTSEKRYVKLGGSCTSTLLPNAYLRYNATEHYHFYVYKGIKVKKLDRRFEIKLPKGCVDSKLYFSTDNDFVMHSGKVNQNMLIDYLPIDRNSQEFEDSVKFYILSAKEILDSDPILLDSVTYYLEDSK